MQGKASIRNLYRSCLSHGTGDAKVSMPVSDLYALICISIRDLEWQGLVSGADVDSVPCSHFYDIPFDWFLDFDHQDSTPATVMSLLSQCLDINSDFQLYIENLSSIHRRRTKFRRILSQQPVPTMDQIGPRVLLEYGFDNVEVLANWMVWRKWVYDIDNRSAQETGYLFEPILASCLGGEPVSAKKSPVKRVDEFGVQNGKGEGRQIDCLVPSTNTIYELKLRVTIAASGQGRFGEELSFPFEANIAGYKPVLLVLDPTPSARLTELSDKFRGCGGEVYQGEAAWLHMDEEAGDVMAVFIDKYIKPAIKDIESFSVERPADIALTWGDDAVTVSGLGHQMKFRREAK